MAIVNPDLHDHRKIVVIATFESSVLLRKDTTWATPLWNFPRIHKRTVPYGLRSVARRTLIYVTGIRAPIERFRPFGTIDEPVPIDVFKIDLTSEDASSISLKGDAPIQIRLFPFTELEGMSDLKNECRRIIRGLGGK